MRWMLALNVVQRAVRFLERRRGSFLCVGETRRPADGCMGVRTGGPLASQAMSKVPTAAYSIGLKIVLDNVPGTLGRFAVAIGEAGGNIAGATGFEAKGPSVSRTIDINARD